MAATRSTHVDPRSPYAVDIHELGRRAGAMRRVTRTVPAPPGLGTEVIGVAEGSDILVEVSLESVVDGVWVAGTASATATGECVRCLDPLQQQLSAELQDLYLYDPLPPGDDEGLDAVLVVDGDWIDIEPAMRDALGTALPFQPVCSPDCPGLCARCGARLADDPDHHHDDVDPRWAALGALTGTGATPPGHIDQSHHSDEEH